MSEQLVSPINTEPPKMGGAPYARFHTRGPVGDAACFCVRLICTTSRFYPLLSATSHITVGDVVSGIVASHRSANRNTAALDGWPHAADAVDSLYTRNPGQFILDGEIELIPLLLREMPVLDPGGFFASKTAPISAALQCCVRTFRVEIPMRANVERTNRQS